MSDDEAAPTYALLAGVGGSILTYVVLRLALPTFGRRALASMREQGVTSFFELGPGKVLAGLVKRQAKEAGLEVKACSISGPEDFLTALG